MHLLQLFLLALSAAAGAQQTVLVATFLDATCSTPIATPQSVLANQCMNLGSFAGSKGPFGMITSVHVTTDAQGLNTHITYVLGCSSPQCTPATCFLSGESGTEMATRQQQCIVTSKTTTFASAVQFLVVTPALVYTVGAYLHAPCLTGTVNGIKQTICPSAIPSYTNVPSGQCVQFDTDVGYVAFMRSNTAAELAYGMAGCDSSCITCTAFSKCRYSVADDAYACISAGGGLLVKKLYEFPDLSDK